MSMLFTLFVYAISLKSSVTRHICSYVLNTDYKNISSMLHSQTRLIDKLPNIRNKNKELDGLSS